MWDRKTGVGQDGCGTGRIHADQDKEVEDRMSALQGE